MFPASMYIAARRVSFGVTQVMAFVVGLSVVEVEPMQAQSTSSSSQARGTRSWELVFASGALVPTGAQRETLADAPLSTAQLAFVMSPRLAVVSSLGWARSRDLLRAGNPRLSVFTYDVGVETRAPRWREGARIGLTPMAGAGFGGRTFNHRGRDVDATHAIAGYVSAGGELVAGRVRVRLELRDYVTGMAPLVGTGRRSARNDVALLAGLRLVRKQRATD